MRRLVLLILVLLCIAAGVIAFRSLRSQSNPNDAVIPILMVLPSFTPTDTPVPSVTPRPTVTASPTWTAVPTETLVPTATATLSVRVLEIVAVMPGVYVAPTLTPFPPGTILLPGPPNPVEPLPDATHTAAPFIGWYSFESDYPTVRYSPPWMPRLSQLANRGQYHRTESANGKATFEFEGEGLRVRYVAARNMGIFDVIVDGVVVDTVDGYAAELVFPATRVYFIGPGWHTMEVRASGRKNPASEGYVVGLDAVQVFRGDANTFIVPPAAIQIIPGVSPGAPEDRGRPYGRIPPGPGNPRTTGAHSSRAL